MTMEETKIMRLMFPWSSFRSFIVRSCLHLTSEDDVAFHAVNMTAMPEYPRVNLTTVPRTFLVSWRGESPLLGLLTTFLAWL